MSYAVAFLAVIDRLISLLKRREEVNRSTFNDVLSPAMASIEEVHKDYLASFARYRSGLKDTAIQGWPPRSIGVGRGRNSRHEPAEHS